MTREEAIRELRIQFLGEYGRQRKAKDMGVGYFRTVTPTIIDADKSEREDKG